MTKEELEKEAEEYYFDRLDPRAIDSISEINDANTESLITSAYFAGAEPREKRIAELEEKISVLLSCKNCPENKGGFICVKEYENKCLSQKIQYIKELKEENAELRADNDARKFAMAMSEKVEKQLREENEKLKTDYEVLSCSVGDFGELQDRLEEEQRKNNGLEEELEKWKDEWQEQVQKATDEGYARTQLQIENGKLKEQIEELKNGIAERNGKLALLTSENQRLQNCWNCKKSFNKSCSFGKKCEADKKKCKEWEIKEK